MGVWRLQARRCADCGGKPYRRCPTVYHAWRRPGAARAGHGVHSAGGLPPAGSSWPAPRPSRRC